MKISILIGFLSLMFFSSCQIGYLLRSSYSHISMLSSRVPIEEALNSSDLTEEQKRKIQISQEARTFSFSELGLEKSNNYAHFVQLGRPYVTYTVMASYKWKMEPYLWSFPIIGKAPYKGFYNDKLAKEEAEEMKKKGFDVYVRGVSAYSTLGKFFIPDPLLSSMLNYQDYDLVNTVIHELVHTTLFIKDNIDFNERLAVFVANKGTEMFYIKREGPDSPTVQKIKDENEDDKLFSAFISKELDSLKKWYNEFTPPDNLSDEDKEKIRQERFNQIRTHFTENLKPNLKTKSYSRFAEGELNNARLSALHTYMKDLQDFEKVYIQSGRSIPLFLERVKQLDSVDDPEKELKAWAQKD